MKVSFFSSLKKYRLQYGSLLFHVLFPLLISLFAGLLLFNTPVMGNLVTVLISFGLDPLRAQFIAALMMAAGSAFIGAVWNQRKAGAILGAAIIFSFAYLTGFVRLEMQPVRDPAGTLEPLNIAALIHTSVLIEALALLCAFIGAAIGVALGEVLLTPFYHLVYAIWQRAMRRDNGGTLPENVAESPRLSPLSIGIWPWLAAGLMILFIVLASGSEDLFLYSPDIGLHISPPLSAHSSQPAHGSIVEDSVVRDAHSSYIYRLAIIPRRDEQNATRRSIFCTARPERTPTGSLRATPRSQPIFSLPAKVSRS